MISISIKNWQAWIALLISTASLVFTYIQSNNNDKAFHELNDPLLAVEDVRFMKAPDSNLVVNIRYRNFGKTIAYDVATIGALDSEIVFREDAHPASQHSLLAPEMFSNSPSSELDSLMVDKIVTGKQKLYLSFKIFYENAAHEKWVFKYLSVFNVHIGNFDILETGTNRIP